MRKILFSVRLPQDVIDFLHTLPEKGMTAWIVEAIREKMKKEGRT